MSEKNQQPPKPPQPQTHPQTPEQDRGGTKGNTFPEFQNPPPPPPPREKK